MQSLWLIKVHPVHSQRVRSTSRKTERANLLGTKNPVGRFGPLHEGLSEEGNPILPGNRVSDRLKKARNMHSKGLRRCRELKSS